MNDEPKEVLMNEEQVDNQARLPRVVVDLKIPLWGIVLAGSALVWGLVSMYFSQQDVVTKISELQVLVRAANAQTMQLVSDQALLKFRVEKLEARQSNADARQSNTGERK